MLDKLPLPDAKRWNVYDKVITTLQSDPDLKRVIRPKSWHTYSGRPDESAAFGSGGYPCVAITPAAVGVTGETPVSQLSPLVLKIDIGTPGLSARNLFALWEAIERAAFVGDARGRMIAALQVVYTRVVGLRITAPAIHPVESGTDAGVMCATGTVEINLMV